MIFCMLRGTGDIGLQSRGHACITRTFVAVSHVRESMSKPTTTGRVYVQLPIEEWVNPKPAFYSGVRNSNHRGQVDRK